MKLALYKPFFIFVAILFSCTNDTKQPNDESQLISEGQNKIVNYFPEEISHYNEWFSEQLHTMEEPIIYEYDNPAIESIRLTILPTFGHPLSVRLEINTKDKETIYFFAKSHSGSGGYPHKKDSINLDTKKIISDHGVKTKKDDKYVAFSSWDFISEKLEAFDFWNQKIDSMHGGRDGTEYIVEVYKGGRYHVLHRWSPSLDSFDKVIEFADLINTILVVGESDYRNKKIELVDLNLKK